MHEIIVGAAFILIAVPLYIRLFKFVIYISLISGLLFILTFIVSKNTNLEPYNELEYNKTRGQKFYFFKKLQWSDQNKNLKIKEELQDVDKEIYPNNFLINETLNKIISFILRDFVESWFQRISPRKAFVVALRSELAHIVRSLQSRLVNVDFADLLVHNLVPILNNHIEKIIIANDAVMHAKATKKLKNITESELLLQNYDKGSLHPAVKDQSNTRDKTINTHLSKSLEKILPFIMDEKEWRSMPCRILVLELLTCCVMKPICNMLSDSDFYNSIISNLLSKQIKERNNVKRLRSVLRRQSLNSLSKSTLKNGESVNLMSHKLTMNTSKKDYEFILKMVENSTDNTQLLMYQYYLLLKNENYVKLNPKYTEDESKVLQKYIKRCNEIILIIDSKIGKKDSNINEILKNTQTLITASNKQDFAKGELKKDYSLRQILSSAKRLEYFSLYMKQRGDRKDLLDFWTAVESLRNPLEFNEPQTSFSNSHLERSEIDNEAESDDSSDEENVFVDSDFLYNDEIKLIFSKYFNLPVMKIPPKIYYKVSEFIEGGCTDRLAYHKARRNVLKLQEFEYIRMKKSDFVAFKLSDFWIQLVIDEALLNGGEDIFGIQDTERKLNDAQSTGLNGATKSLSNISKETYGDPLANYPDKEDGLNYIDVNMTGKVSDKVVKAVEDALNQIMNDDVKAIGLKELDNTSNDKRNSRLVSEDVAKDLFGADDTFITDIDDGFTNRITESTDDDLINMSQSDISDHPIGIVDSESIDSGTPSLITGDFASVTPRNLNLSSEIADLDVEIARLQKQKLIIETLLKKAEIINNVPELRLLKRSMISLEKELKLKSMQREQYIVQDSKNSLYQCSRVSITNYLSTRDNNGKEFIMFVVKVEKFGPENKSSPSTWMVTRRFSQFYDLHNYLKKKYSRVEEIEFPKRSVVMKFMQGPVLEERRKRLENYLKILVSIEDICSDRVFRDFLSSETFDTSREETLFQESNSKKRNADGSGTKLYNIVFSQALYPILSMVNMSNNSIDLDHTTAKGTIDDHNKNEKILVTTSQEFGDKSNLLNSFSESGSEEVHDMEADIKMKDISFVKPVCDFIVTVFHLNSAASWIRGKAMVMLFQQIFGSTVEKMLRSNIDGKIKSEETISQCLLAFQSSLWPDEKFRQSKSPKTLQEREKTRTQAKEFLRLYMVDTTSKIFGQTAASEAANTIYIALQNDVLNLNLVLSILDETLKCVFPEIR